MENPIAKELEEQAAEKAIDWMDTVPQSIGFTIVEGIFEHDINITKTDLEETMERITEILSDLFHKHRRKKVDLCGDAISSATIPIPNKSLRGQYMPGMTAVRQSEGL